MENSNIAPVLILFGLAGAILYLHFTGGRALTRMYVTGVLLATATLILLPSLNVPMPDWWKSWFPTPTIQLGLDLQGGTHLLLEVKVEDAVKNAMQRRGEDLKRELRDNKVAFQEISSTNGVIVAKLAPAQPRAAFQDIIDKVFPDLNAVAIDSAAGPAFELHMRQRDVSQLRTNAMEQALETIRNRIDQLGVRETTVVREGENNILVQLPGIQDPGRAKELIGKTAVLEFKIVDDNHSVDEAVREAPPPGDDLLYGSPERGGRQPYLVESPLLMTGDVVTDARVRPGGRLEGPYVSVDLDSRGARIFDALTSENVGRRLAIILDNTVYSAPVIKERIPGGKVSITGRFSMDEAHDLAIVLRSGALPAPVEMAEERTVGPSLGRDSIRQGQISFLVGAVGILVFMAVYYSGAGLVADFGLGLNILLLICVMAAMQATLTLPGIAGIVLTLGMSVDANVLINERMREELRNGKTPRDAVKIGYERAWSAISDSNITTFVAGLILFQFGTGPVKGFAVTLCVGVLTGLFSCVVVTRIWYDHLISSRKLTTISV